MRLTRFKINGFNRNTRPRQVSHYRGSVGIEEKYCIFFINPDDGRRSEYMRNLSREEAEQRVYALRFLNLSPFMERQIEYIDEDAEADFPLPAGKSWLLRPH